jgi:hypothetical protein
MRTISSESSSAAQRPILAAGEEQRDERTASQRSALAAVGCKWLLGTYALGCFKLRVMFNQPTFKLFEMTLPNIVVLSFENLADPLHE